MKTNDIIAIITACIALISVVFSIITTLRSNHLQTEILRLTEETREFEIAKGEQQLLQLLSRYFVVQLNCWEPNGKMKTDQASVEKYICELKLIDEDARAIRNNPFYYEIATKYPEIDLLWISLRGLITERENDNQMALDLNTFERFRNLFHKVKKKSTQNAISNRRIIIV